MSKGEAFGRLIMERDQTQERVAVLRSFLTRGRPDSISQRHWTLLIMQEKAMGLYLDILNERIDIWE